MGGALLPAPPAGGRLPLWAHSASSDSPAGLSRLDAEIWLGVLESAPVRPPPVDVCPREDSQRRSLPPGQMARSRARER